MKNALLVTAAIAGLFLFQDDVRAERRRPVLKTAWATAAVASGSARFLVRVATSPAQAAKAVRQRQYRLGRRPVFRFRSCSIDARTQSLKATAGCSVTMRRMAMFNGSGGITFNVT